MSEPHRPADHAAPRQTSWLSQGFEELQRLVCGHRAQRDAGHRPAGQPDFDVVIVGSGYGGALAARELAGSVDADGHPVSVCVLERGREYLPGMFPAGLSELPPHLRATMGRGAQPVGDREGLFDLRVGEDVTALVANGLGGGSLINAGVMARPAATVLADPAWPRRLRDEGLAIHYDEAEHLLGARDRQGPNIVDRAADGPPAKTFSLRRLSPSHYRAAPVTVAHTDRVNGAGVSLRACIGCGDCATGCNHHAKESLDTNLLVDAQRRGARLYTGATVLRLTRESAAGLWALSVVHTARPLRDRDPAATRITASRVILAAGTFGSTEILLRSRSDTLRFSERLGQRFSANGDMIAVAYGQALPANATADEYVDAAARRVGPTITGIVDLRDQPGDDGRPLGVVVEDLAIPGGLRRLLEESTALSLTLDRLKERDAGGHVADAPALDPCAIDRQAMLHTLPVAVMGQDSASGAIELVRGDGDIEDDLDGDGAVAVRWPRLRSEPLFQRQIDQLQQLVARSRTGGRVLPNPMWRLLPAELDFLFGGQLGPPFTVHPLGGCVMGDDAACGVVDDLGRVFDAGRPDNGVPALMPGLVVLDGAMIPLSLGINPALTIAAVALRAVRRLRDREWGLRPPAAGPLPALGERPVYRVPATPKSEPTVVRNLERMSGAVVLDGLDGARVRCVVELTLPFEPVPIDALMSDMRRELKVDAGAQWPGAARLRLFRLRDWEAIVHPRPMARRAGPGSRHPVEQRLDEAALLIAPVTGAMCFFHREASSERQRIFHAWVAWLFNRGLRDSWQWFWERVQNHAPGQAPADGGAGLLGQVRQRLRSSLDLASRAGEVRRFDYALELGPPIVDRSAAVLGEGRLAAQVAAGRGRISGHKRLTYGWLANPWEQMSTLALTEFPLLRPYREPPLLQLDLPYLARQQVPIMKVDSREDEVRLIVDLVSFGLYMLRVLIGVHAWSFRKPDAPFPREPQRLPGRLRTLGWRGGLMPHVVELELDRLSDGTPVRARLTRYARLDATEPPVLMIHGYSASGTTFAHPAVSPGLASYLHARRRDVWVLDMRTSSGMPTAHLPWTFEDAALQDIPAAIDRVVEVVGRERGATDQQVDVVAHCMGSAMFSMALLAPPQAGDRFYVERQRLPERVRRVVLSQVGPLMVFSPMNIFRAYVMRWLLQLLPLAGYTFRPREDAGVGDQLLDRLLASLPYPADERRTENPLRFWRATRFVATRHRMDALYGRSFSLANLNRRTLRAIDDMFGPLSIATVAQTIHFAQRQLVTNHAGRNVFVSRQTLGERWRGIATLSLHGLDNGLVDPATLARMQAIVGNDAALDFEFEELAGVGHQDTLIGRDSARVFARIEAFLHDPRPPRLPAPEPRPWLAQVPWIGPLVGPLQVEGPDGPRLTVSASASPALGRARCAAVLAVRRAGDRFVLASGSPVDVVALPPDVDGWLNLEVRIEGWADDAVGLLVVLLYDQPAELDRATTALDAQGRASRLAQVAALAPSAPDDDGVDATAVADPPPATGAGSPGAADDATATATATATVAAAATRAVRHRLRQSAEAGGGRSRLRRAAPSEQRLADRTADAGPAGGVPGDPRVHAAIAALLGGSTADELIDGFIELAPRRRSPYGTRTRFVFASCQYPAGMLVEQIAHASYERMRAMVEAQAAIPGGQPPRALLLLGDQIYTDATAGLFDPSDADARDVKPYERLFRIPPLRWLLRRVPAFMMLDDHELVDNWEPAADGSKNQARLVAGRAGYLKFQRCAGPPRMPATGDSTHPLWYPFEVDGLPFFMVDSRTERKPRRMAALDDARMISDAQFTALRDWLLAQHRRDLFDGRTGARARPKFIASPAMLFPRRLRNHEPGARAGAWRADGWDGYPGTCNRLLALIAGHRIDNVVFLSGDEHLAIVARATLGLADGTLPPVVVHSLHCPALFAPYPFANAAVAEFAERERWRFESPDDLVGQPRSFDCEVEVRWFGRGDGFAMLDVDRADGRCTVRYSFPHGEVSIPL